MDSLFSAQGRLGRLAYLARFTLLIPVFLIAALVVALLYKLNSYIGIGVGVILYIGVVVYSIIQGIKRAHDMNLSGWFMLILFIPIVGGIFGLVLLLAPGTKEPNRFGDVPETQQWEKVCGWIQVVLFVIAIPVGFKMASTFEGMMQKQVGGTGAVPYTEPYGTQQP